MRIKNYDLNLSAYNKKIKYPTELDIPLESYYHAGTNCSFYEINGTNFLLFLDDLSYLRKPEYLQKIHIVTENDINRLDKISYKYYNTPELWWLIAEVNYIDPFELYVNQELIIPNIREFDFRSMIKSSFQQQSSD